MLEWIGAKLTENPNWSITFGVIGILIVLAVVAIREAAQKIKQGKPWDKAISDGMAKAFYTYREGFDSFYQLLFRSVLYICGALLALALILSAFEALL